VSGQANSDCASKAYHSFCFLGGFFALDHANYFHWLSVHGREQTMLEETHPDNFEKFWVNGFVAWKTKWSFSVIALDQTQKQCNAEREGL
jgi:hypothetical protein